MNLRKLVALLLAVMMLACSVSAMAETAEEPKYGGILVAYTSADPMNFDPATLTAWDQTIVAANILEGLVRLNPEGTGIEEGRCGHRHGRHRQ